MEERRNSFRRRAGALIFVGLAMPALACVLPPGKRVESAALALSYRTEPAKIAVGEPFVLELAACPKDGKPLPERVKLDAHMPEHKHGMNYRPSIVADGAGRYRSEGWIFHMPGRWEFVFDFGSEQLVDSVRIE
jgi:hypothetical protein